MKIHHLSLIAAVLGVVTVSVSRPARAQTMSLPTYYVTQTGATSMQASNLASLLAIPPSKITLNNGLASFIDPTNWLYVPTVPVTDPTVISNLTAVSENPTTNALSFYALNFTALNSLPVYSSNAAISSASAALAGAGLTPVYGTPVAGNAQLIASYTAGSGATNSANAFLDTSVSYQFTDPGGGGYPLIGPGAQVQIAYSPTGSVTRLLYSARQYTEGPYVSLISSSDASNRAAALLPPNAQVNFLQLVYYSPALISDSGSCCVQTIIPWYAFNGTVMQYNPLTGSNNIMNTPLQLIPATDDPTYVPTLVLSVAAPGLTQVVANVAVGGGAPPYTYTWSGSNPDVSTNTGASITYTPVSRVSVPRLSIDGSALATGHVVTLSWPDASTGFVVQSTTDLVTTAWADYPTTPADVNGTNVVTIPVDGSPQVFFRLRQSLSQTDTVEVVVTDANGVSVHVSTTVLTAPQPRSHEYEDPVFPSFGTEAPYYAGGWVNDVNDWRSVMRNPNVGCWSRAESFFWANYSSWPGDFMEPTPRCSLQAILPSCTPGFSAYADADYLNWGVNAANFVLYLGHGAPTAISFTWPNWVPMNGGAAYGLWLRNPGVNMLADYWINNNGIPCWTYNLLRSWGNQGSSCDHLDWLAFYSCEVLQYCAAEFNACNPRAAGNFAACFPNAWQRWGSAFNGLHIALGFHTEMYYAPMDTASPFAVNMLTSTNTIVGAWFSASTATQPNGPCPNGPVVAAAMGPIGPGGVTDINDRYCGPIGPSIPPPYTNGWWYLHN